MKNFYGKINDDYAWELELFSKYRTLKDGLNIFESNLCWDRYAGDHNPQFGFSLTILNVIIFDFSVYNIWHMDHPNSPFYGKHRGNEDCCGSGNCCEK